MDPTLHSLHQLSMHTCVSFKAEFFHYIENLLMNLYTCILSTLESLTSNLAIYIQNYFKVHQAECFNAMTLRSYLWTCMWYPWSSGLWSFLLVALQSQKLHSNLWHSDLYMKTNMKNDVQWSQLIFYLILCVCVCVCVWVQCAVCVCVTVCDCVCTVYSYWFHEQAKLVIGIQILLHKINIGDLKCSYGSEINFMRFIVFVSTTSI